MKNHNNFKKISLLASATAVALASVIAYANVGKEAKSNNSQVRYQDYANFTVENAEVVKIPTINEKAEENENKFEYYEEISMPKEHQEYLFELCLERELEYEKVLSIIALESDFNKDLISKTNDYGYMQINKVNHKNLSKILGTENKPLDPYINLNWGTYMLSELYSHWNEKNINNDGDGTFNSLDKYVMSSYNRGLGGFKKHGIAKKYIELVEKRYNELFSTKA